VVELQVNPIDVMHWQHCIHASSVEKSAQCHVL